ncbi:MAG: metalloregulator ArsR/SmtB family transcription factor [Rhodobacteraceae bacterium]|nr:metalloregulator ArsR/SmtB family transcription factor [Paracoccaceae bacterium]
MPHPAVQHAEVFDALGSDVRRELLDRLVQQPRTVGELARGLPISRPAVSRHLKVLQDAGLIACEAQGNRNLYRVRPDGFGAAQDWLGRFWGDALNRFRLVAENTAPRHDD